MEIRYRETRKKEPVREIEMKCTYHGDRGDRLVLGCLEEDTIRFSTRDGVFNANIRISRDDIAQLWPILKHYAETGKFEA